MKITTNYRGKTVITLAWGHEERDEQFLVVQDVLLNVN